MVFCTVGPFGEQRRRMVCPTEDYPQDAQYPLAIGEAERTCVLSTAYSQPRPCWYKWEVDEDSVSEVSCPAGTSMIDQCHSYCSPAVRKHRDQTTYERKHFIAVMFIVLEGKSTASWQGVWWPGDRHVSEEVAEVELTS